MGEENRFIDDYTHHELFVDQEDDLERTSAWFFNAAHTAPGEPRQPMFNYMYLNQCINNGFHYACEKISMPTTYGVEHRSYRGYEFARATLVPEKERKRREAGFREGLRPVIENFEQLWTADKEEHWSRCKGIQQFDFESASWFELDKTIYEYVDINKRLMEIHMYWMVGVGSVYILFEELCSELIGLDDTHPQFQALLAGFHNRAFETDRQLFRLAFKARESGFEHLFLTTEPEEVIPNLEKSEAGRQWIKEFRDFLQTDGWRMPIMFEFRTPTWVEDPTMAIVHLRQFMEKGPDFDIDESIRKRAKEREEAEREILSRIPVDMKDWFTALMKVAQRFGMWNEDHTFYLDQMTWATGRYMWLQIGKRLAGVNAIEDAEDILFLIPDEAHKLLGDPGVNSAKERVKRRRADWEDAKKITPSPVFLKEGVTVERAMEEMAESKDIALRLVAIGKMPKPKAGVKADLWGAPVSRGIAEGPARVIFSPDQLGEVKPGEILVAPGTFSAWTPIFALISGAVIDRGGIMSHSCIIGREYGIPVVINVIEGSSKIKTGQRLKVDANLGAVWILS